MAEPSQKMAGVSVHWHRNEYVKGLLVIKQWRLNSELL